MKASLCQNKNHSCAACCGFLNLRFVETSLSGRKNKLSRIFQERTERILGLSSNFSKFNREALHQYEQKQRSREEQLGYIHEDIYVCPFLGYLNDKKINPQQEKRIGCLLHPEAWNVTTDDYRDLSFYGKSICAGYDCQSKEKLNDNQMRILDQLVGLDNLDYSALIANYLLLKNQFRLLAKIFNKEESSYNDKILQLLPQKEFHDLLSNWFRSLIRWQENARQPLYSYSSFFESSSMGGIREEDSSLIGYLQKKGLRGEQAEEWLRFYREYFRETEFLEFEENEGEIISLIADLFHSLGLISGKTQDNTTNKISNGVIKGALNECFELLVRLKSFQ